MIDIAQAEVPSADARVASRVLWWDGRLDNARELERTAPSDPAAMVAAYDRWGIEGLGRAVGDWSIVIKDACRGCLVLASDYAAVRPLYYHRRGDRVCWSSQLGTLAQAVRVEEIDEGYVRAFIERGGGAHRTPYVGIEAVPGGHAVRLSAAGISVERFWTPPVGARIRYRDEREYDERLRVLFAEAVGSRLRTHGTVLAELSGGLDSSSVVCMADRLIRTGAVPARALTTVSYVHRDSGDLRFIKAVEQYRGRPGVHLSTHDHPLVTAADTGAAAPRGWGPLYRSTALVARSAGAAVLLTGQNGDLVMGNWFDDSLQVAAQIRRADVAAAATEALAWSRATREPMPSILGRAMLAALPARWTPERAYAPGPEAENDLDPAFLGRTAAASSWTPWADPWREAPPERRSHFRALALMREMRSLQRTDELSGIDCTHPFAHRPLVEFLLSIPADVLCRPGEPRRLMRRALSSSWPTALRARRSKSLFGAPWVAALRPLAADMLARPSWDIVERGWVKPEPIRAKLQRLVHGVGADEPQLRQIILLEYWLRNRGQAQRHQPPAA